MRISFFKRVKSKEAEGHFPLQQIMNDIKSEKYMKVIMEYRRNGKMDEFKRNNLSAFTPHGTFQGPRSKNSCSEYNQVVCLDIDDIPPEGMTEIRRQLESNEYVRYLFLSPGEGLKVFVRHSGLHQDHERAYNQILSLFEKQLGIRIDSAPKADNALCYVSYDPDLYENENASIYELRPATNEEHWDSTFDDCINRVSEKRTYLNGRNNFVYALACDCNRHGLPEDFTRSNVVNYYSDLPEGEAVRTVKKAYNQHPVEFGVSKVNSKSLEGFIHQQRLLYDVVNNRLVRDTGKVMSEREINTIYLDSQKYVVPKPTAGAFFSAINSTLIPEVNPLKIYFGSLGPYGGNRVEEFLDHIKIKNAEVIRPLIVKWLVSVVASVYGFLPDIVLVMIGKQGNGKTKFFTRLLPDAISEYFTVDKLDRGKDSDMLMCSKLIILDDEFGGKSKKDAGHFKSMTSMSKFSLRPPYGKTSQDFKRLAVLCGTSNHSQILNDPTGNRRVIPVELITRDYEKSDRIDRVELWAQIKNIFFSREDDSVFRLTPEEYKIVNSLSEQHQFTNSTRELIDEYFEPAKVGEGEHMQATQIMRYLLAQGPALGLNGITVGKELSNMGFEKVSYNRRYGYWVRRK